MHTLEDKLRLAAQVEEEVRSATEFESLRAAVLKLCVIVKNGMQDDASALDAMFHR